MTRGRAWLGATIAAALVVVAVLAIGGRDADEVDAVDRVPPAPPSAPAGLAAEPQPSDSTPRAPLEAAPTAARGPVTTLRVLWNETPLAGAGWTIGAGQVISGVTDSEGRAPLQSQVVDGWGTQKIRVSYPGFPLVEVARPSPLPEVVDVSLRPHDGWHVAVYAGTVRDERGDPISGARVGPRFDASVGATTRPDGTFRWVQPYWKQAPGAAASAPGYFAKEFALPAEGAASLDVRLARDTYHAVVALEFVGPDGTPVPGVRGRTVQGPPSAEASKDPAIGLTRVLDWDRHRRAGVANFDGDAQGRAVIPTRVPGRMQVRGSGSGFVVDEPVDVVAPETRVRLRLVPGRVAVGQAVIDVDAGWRCEHDHHVFGVAVMNWQAAATVDPSGRFRVEGLPFSTVELHVEAGGHPSVIAEVPADPSRSVSVVDLGRVLVPDARLVQGTVTYSDGSPLDSGSIEWLDGARARGAGVEKGRFSFRVPRPTGGARARVHSLAGLPPPGWVDVAGPLDASTGRVEIVLPLPRPTR